MSLQGLTFYEDFYPRGFRKVLAIAVITLTSLIPATHAWQHEPAAVPLHGAQGQNGGGLSIGFTILAMFGATFGMALYYPSWGYKRYALLCGPFIGLGAIMVTHWYLTGRVKVYKFEPVLAAFVGALPGLAVYTLLARRKWRKRHPAVDDDIVDSVEVID